ncbi:hypothetical protein H0H81_007134 [Sphagnurus paluster]|uniref:Uncharacterized protein n=1 Tax=Sphagnurus paluster TaxID=117069 RepID=A0A9P7K595_9AGAR|nr:hypothetical protein H0H81_007134 [Sphagnurus paluster]
MAAYDLSDKNFDYVNEGQRNIHVWCTEMKESQVRGVPILGLIGGKIQDECEKKGHGVRDD